MPETPGGLDPRKIENESDQQMTGIDNEEQGASAANSTSEAGGTTEVPEQPEAFDATNLNELANRLKRERLCKRPFSAEEMSTLREALRVAQAKLKTISKANPDWAATKETLRTTGWTHVHAFAKGAISGETANLVGWKDTLDGYSRSLDAEQGQLLDTADKYYMASNVSHFLG